MRKTVNGKDGEILTYFNSVTSAGLLGLNLTTLAKSFTCITPTDLRVSEVLLLFSFSR